MRFHPGHLVAAVGLGFPRFGTTQGRLITTQEIPSRPPTYSFERTLVLAGSDKPPIRAVAHSVKTND